MKTHRYRTSLRWTSDRGKGTAEYRAYARGFEVRASGKSAAIAGSADPAFRGDAVRYNPEELLVAALSSCHMLRYPHLCADAGIVVREYRDEADGELIETADGGGECASATLHPQVVVASADTVAAALALHDRAHALCFIARSVKFPVGCEPTVSAR